MAVPLPTVSVPVPGPDRPERFAHRYQPEYELVDTGIFDQSRYWIVEVHYAKADPDDLLMKISRDECRSRCRHAARPTNVLVPQYVVLGGQPAEPAMAATGDTSVGIEHPGLGSLELMADAGPDGATPGLLFCENETNLKRLYGAEPIRPTPKTESTTTSSTGCRQSVRSAPAPSAPSITKSRSRQARRPRCGCGSGPRSGRFTERRLRRPVRPGNEQRRAEADEFYAELTPTNASADEAMVMRQGFGGLLWSKQLFYYDVRRWLRGDPSQPPPPQQRQDGRNCRWNNFNAFDIMSMPDKWEYPWFAAWDLGFHCVAMAHVDPAFAKYQLILLCREWFQHPNGALPAYEWDFSDVNPPVQAWAALEVFAIDGGRDIDFISRVFDKLMVNFNWWVNREDSESNNLFEGGFLGLDNIGPIDRSHLPAGFILEQSDGTGWMGFYAVAMATMAVVLDLSGQRPAQDLVMKYNEHLASIAQALEGLGLWDDTDGFYYDRLKTPSGEAVPVKTRSMVGIIPALAAAVLSEAELQRALSVGKTLADFLISHDMADRHRMIDSGLLRGQPGQQRLLLSLCGRERLERLGTKLFDQEEFLSPYGLRALSAYHRQHPYTFKVDGFTASIDYEPAESTTPMFGGNSNWRGPIWFPLNYLMVSTLERYHRFYRDDYTIEYPTGSGQWLTLDKVADDLSKRLISIFTNGPDGRRPCFGGTELLQNNPDWHDNLIFSEYFHGDNGAAIGAFHQTGWTALIADLIRRRYGEVEAVDDVVKRIGAQAEK